jgi:hypothetical protein
MDAALAWFRLLAYLAAGGFLSLAAIPQGEVSRGFFRFSAALYAGLIAAGLAIGYASLERAPLALFAAAALVGAVQAALVPVLGTRPGRGLIAAAAALGALATIVDGSAGNGGVLGGIASLFSALLLGSTITAMVLGHWYLVMPALPPDPLLRLTRLYAGSVLLRGIVVIAAFALLYAAQGRALDRFLDRAGLILWPRLLFGLGAPAVLALMALPTVRVRDTQPATGMLYVACVLVLAGEGIAHYLTIKTGVPI